MSGQQRFAIPWSIPEEQWEKARAAMITHERGSAYDRRGLGRYYLLYGDVDFVYGAQRFYGDAYGADGINVSLFDLAIALASAWLERRFDPGASITYEQLDDDLRIHFAGEPDVIRVTASDRADALLVSRGAFQEGVVAFVCAVASAMRQKLPGVLEWESLAPLEEVAVRNSAS